MMLSLASRFVRPMGGLRALATASKLKITALNGRHKELKGKMIDFEGWEMPVQYGKDGVLTSTKHCRANASLFDVSHMGQVRIYGQDRAKFLEKFVVGDIQILKPGRGRYSLITNEKGGIVDDTVITAYEDHIYMVINAGCIDKDLKHMQTVLDSFEGDASMIFEDMLSLVALQGPKAVEVLSRMVTEDLTPMGFMTGRRMELDRRFDCLVTRCGYTGEDGFEISVPTRDVFGLFDALLEHPEVAPAGLGARDALRLEAGLCLYGHDLDETITPVQADLTFAINKRRKAEGGFLGSDVILAQLKDGPPSKRIGFEVVKGAPAREGAEILDKSENIVGKVTSGTFSPTLGKAIGMGYVDTSLAVNDTTLFAKVRNNLSQIRVVPTPFVPTNYYKPPKKK